MNDTQDTGQHTLTTTECLDMKQLIQSLTNSCLKQIFLSYLKDCVQSCFQLANLIPRFCNDKKYCSVTSEMLKARCHFRKHLVLCRKSPESRVFDYNVTVMSTCILMMYSVNSNKSHSRWQWQQSVIVLLITAAASSVSASNYLWWKKLTHI